MLTGSCHIVRQLCGCGTGSAIQTVTLRYDMIGSMIGCGMRPLILLYLYTYCTVTILRLEFKLCIRAND